MSNQQPDQRIWPTDTPTSQPAPLSIARRISASLRRLPGAIAGLTTTPGIITTPDGVTYQPLARTTLDQALADIGHLDFAVTFPKRDTEPPTRTRMRIRATRERVFHELGSTDSPTDPAFRSLVYACIAAARPGDRLLLLGAGTGTLTAFLADHVGPAGAVTAFEADAQSVAFARARYPLPNAAHERLSTTTLTAEPKGAAESIILTPLAPAQRPLSDPTELLSRLTRPGRLLLAGRHTMLTEAFRSVPGISVEPLAPPNDQHPTDSPFVLVRKLPTA